MQPVFIGGCDRSGTTMLGAMLGSHSQCLTVPESQFKISVLQEMPIDVNQIDPKLLLQKIDRHWRFKLWHLQLDNQDITFDFSDGNPYRNAISWLVKQYGQQYCKQDAKYWIDHTPSNLKHGVTLSDLFPDAHFIHIVRDGRAVAASVRSLDWGPNTVFYAAQWWMEKIAHGLALETSWLSDRVIRIRYEDLVAKPEEAVQALCSFLDLSFEPNMLFPQGLRLPAYTQSQHQLIGKPLDNSRINYWQNTLSTREVEVFEALTGDLLSSLGYCMQYGLLAKRITTFERIQYAWLEFIRRQLNKRRYRHRFLKG